jgi:acyl-CoA thioester hydrolase
MITCDVQIRVRYGETDRMGYSYYGCYPLYYEIGRTELLRQYDLAYKELEDNGILLPVLDMNVEYIAPALYDELITIKTSVKSKPGVKIVFFYEIFNSRNELINKATTTLVFVDKKNRKPCRPPENFIKQIEEYF